MRLASHFSRNYLQRCQIAMEGEKGMGKILTMVYGRYVYEYFYFLRLVSRIEKDDSS